MGREAGEALDREINHLAPRHEAEPGVWASSQLGDTKPLLSSHAPISVLPAASACGSNCPSGFQGRSSTEGVSTSPGRTLFCWVGCNQLESLELPSCLPQRHHPSHEAHSMVDGHALLHHGLTKASWLNGGSVKYRPNPTSAVALRFLFVFFLQLQTSLSLLQFLPLQASILSWRGPQAENLSSLCSQKASRCLFSSSFLRLSESF